MKLLLHSLLIVSIFLFNVCSSNEYSPFISIGKYCGRDPQRNLIEKSYYVPRYVRGTWSEALLFCRAFGMDLAGFDTLDEYNAVGNLKRRHSSLFTGWTHIGGMASRMNNHDWFWVHSEEKIAYSIPWNGGEPNGNHVAHGCTCVGPTPDSMGLNDLPCYKHYDDFTFICQKVDAFVEQC